VNDEDSSLKLFELSTPNRDITQENLAEHMFKDTSLGMTTAQESLKVEVSTKITLGIFSQDCPDELELVEASSTNRCGILRKCVIDKFSLQTPERKIVLMKGDTILDPMHTLGEAGLRDNDKLSFIVKL